MKYLTAYKLFESSDSVDLSKVEEAFYNISDNLDVKIYFKKASEIFFEDKILTILIREKDISLDKKIDFIDIKDDLEFALNYLESELGLTLYSLNIHSINGHYGPNKSFKKYEDFMKYLNWVELSYHLSVEKIELNFSI